MNKKLQTSGLGIQLFAGVLVSLLAAVLAFALFCILGNSFLDHTVYGERFSDKMSERQFSRLQEYIAEENITEETLQQLNAWCTRRSGVYLTIYRDDALIYESPVSRIQQSDPESFDPDTENSKKEYELTFNNGVKAQAFLYYFASDAFYFWMLGVSGLLAFAIFSVCFISLIHRKLRYIRRLKKELDILAGGDLSYQVTVQGRDELSELASGIDQMRCSIINHQQAEDAMRSANSQLVTAMSHDLRTPLTSLMVYLEILDRNKIQDEQKRSNLIHQSLVQTLSIKSMVDKLFEYSFVYTSEWEPPEMEIRDADEVLGQFWQEYAFALESNDFSVQTEFEELCGSVEVNTELLRRAFDNLYANIVKYADPSEPVHIRYFRKEQLIVIILQNGFSVSDNRIESTNIGLNTCRRILKMHNGSFETTETDGIFTAEVHLPIVPVG